MYLLNEDLFFVAFNIIISTSFLKISLRLLKSFRSNEELLMSILTIPIDFHRFFGLFEISLLRRKLATDELATLSTYFKKIV